MEYDIRGNKTKMNDPDMGTWTYSYNALGKLVSQTIIMNIRDNLASIKPCVLFFSFAVKGIKVGDFRRGATCCCGHLVDNPCVAPHNAANTPSITRTSSFTYNSDGLLKSETIEPNTDKSLTTTYEYDSFGNKPSPSTQTTIVALKPNNPPATLMLMATY
jgi:YD repeat-containing protein